MGGGKAREAGRATYSYVWSSRINLVELNLLTYLPRTALHSSNKPIDHHWRSLPRKCSAQHSGSISTSPHQAGLAAGSTNSRSARRSTWVVHIHQYHIWCDTSRIRVALVNAFSPTVQTFIFSPLFFLNLQSFVLSVQRSSENSVSQWCLQRSRSFIL